MEENEKSKTAFVTRKGLFQFKVIPFGLTCAPAIFERLNETVLAGLQRDKCIVYLDDIIVIGKSFDKMLRYLEKIYDGFETGYFCTNTITARCILTIYTRQRRNQLVYGRSVFSRNRWKGALGSMCKSHADKSRKTILCDSERVFC